MTIETQSDVAGLKRVGAVVSRVLKAMLDSIEPGMTTAELDALGRNWLAEYGARSAPQVMYDFPGATCISINEEAAHGIPGSRPIQAGDLVNVDVSAELDGYFADTGGTKIVPPTTPVKTRLCHATRMALDAALMQARAGNRINQIGRAIERVAKAHGFKTIRNLAGHGVGRTLHEEPEGIVSYFDASDRRSQSPAAVVNESFANRNFPGGKPLGARFKFGDLGEKGYWYRIVGVVKEIHEVGMGDMARPAVYSLHEQGSSQLMIPPSGIAVRTAVEPASIVSAIRQAIWSIDKDQPIWRVQTLDDIFARQLTTPTQSTALIGAFALLALLLASVGLYGVLSYAVTQRTSEIGVRMALGATSREILLTFGKRGLALTVAGLAIGLALSTVASRFLNALLYGFRPDVIPTMAVVSLSLLAVAALASLGPALRASRVDPVVALRSE